MSKKRSLSLQSYDDFIERFTRESNQKNEWPLINPIKEKLLDIYKKDYESQKLYILNNYSHDDFVNLSEMEETKLFDHNLLNEWLEMLGNN